jgi:hypothetical protein
MPGIALQNRSAELLSSSKRLLRINIFDPTRFPLKTPPVLFAVGRNGAAMRKARDQAAGGARAGKNAGGAVLKPNLTVASGRDCAKAIDSGIDGGWLNTSAPAKWMSAQIGQ